ncbi:uncharacterized protein LOC111080162 isoform X2 [Drosophila obscura]|uniref:uncharacterized protein LOC111080162 isoform X2 n=1 Tax=Drosophila obscura TaxID=7282 RepID=UPI001BB27F4B|nr:uncharacterized protein LOC111080162 isoform X2 [Drosophila obscura]
MCRSVSRQSKCYAVAICAFFYGLLDISVKGYCLVYEGFKPFIVVGLSAWLPILLAATLLLVGASQEMFVLLLTAIVLAMFGGCLWITSSLGMLIDTWGMDKLFLIDSVLGIIAICLFLGLIGLFVYFTCRFMRELQR